MRVFDWICLAFRDIRYRKKAVIINTILIFISITALIVSLSLSKGFNNYYNTLNENGYFLKAISVSVADTELESEEELLNLVTDNLSSMDLVEGICINRDEGFTVIKGIEGLCNSGDGIGVSSMNGSISNLVIAGKSSNLEVNEIIIPKYMFKFEDGNNGWEGDEQSDYIDGEEYIGSYISAQVRGMILKEDYTMVETGEIKEGQFKVVGVYNNIKSFRDSVICYASYETLSKYHIPLKYEIEEMNIPSQYKLSVIVKNGKNRETVHKEIENILNNKGLVTAMVSDNGGYSPGENYYYAFLRFSTMIVAGIILIWAIMNMVITYMRDIKNRRSEYGVMKAIGYTDLQLAVSMIGENIMVSIVSFVSSIIASLYITDYITSNIIGTEGMFRQIMNFSLTKEGILLGLIIVIIVPAISVGTGIYKLHKLNPITALKSQD